MTSTETHPFDGLAPVFLLRMLHALRAGDGVDVVDASVHMVIQKLVTAEGTERIGAGRYERTESAGAESVDQAGDPNWGRSPSPGHAPAAPICVPRSHLVLHHLDGVVRAGK